MNAQVRTTEEKDSPYGLESLDQCLLRAVRYGNVEHVTSYLDQGARIESRDKEGKTAFRLANPMISDIGECLLARGAKIDAPDNQGITALHDAASRGQGMACRWLLDRGSQVNARDLDGRTALHHASGLGFYRCCFLLISQGAHLDSQDIHGKTSLHYAAFVNHVNTCLCLVALGASVDNMPDRDINIKQALTLSPIQAAATLGDLPLLMNVIERLESLEALEALEVYPDPDSLKMSLNQAMAIADAAENEEIAVLLRACLARLSARAALSEIKHAPPLAAAC